MISADDFPMLSTTLSVQKQQLLHDHDDNKSESLHLLEDTETEDDQLNAIRPTVKIRVAMDSGACKSVAHPSVMPSGVAITPHTGGKHFSGAGGETIERYGECTTLLSGKHGSVQNVWNLANVARPLHAVSQIAGPYEGDGNHDILFNNKRCVVVPPGIVDAVLRQIKPVAEYLREGNLYLAEFEMSDFARQGQAP